MTIHIPPSNGYGTESRTVAAHLRALKPAGAFVRLERTGPNHKHIKSPLFTEAGLPPDAKRLSLLELTAHDCAWPVGEGEQVFCGAPVDPLAGSRQRRRYCTFHGELATAGPVWPSDEKPPKEARR